MVTTLAVEDFGLEQEVEVVNVLDLPQLYDQPSYASLLGTLVELKSGPSSLGSTPKSGTPRSGSGASTPFKPPRKVKSEGVPGYLTKIISSKLAWIEHEDEKEELWERAAEVLSERCGRTAIGDITRTFHIPVSICQPSERAQGQLDDKEAIELVVHEPALTGDSLGHKTWTASSLLAQRFASHVNQLPKLSNAQPLLEIGAGTGLVGMAAACVLGAHVIMTDLQEIVPNLQRNADANAANISMRSGKTTVRTLDWRCPSAFNVGGDSAHPPQSFSLILAADVVYSMAHPPLLASVIHYHLMRSPQARLLVELPQRAGFQAELDTFREALQEIGLKVVDEGTELGYDDWSDPTSNEPVEVCCWWSLWAWLKHDPVSLLAQH